MSESPRAVFLSYAREDAAAARRIAEALRAAGLEVWFDENELRGGDTWDAKIRKQIDACALFIPLISAHTQERTKGYFRLEWKLAVDQTHLLAEGVPFLAPVAVDDTSENSAVVPPEFLKVQWTRLPGALPTPQFVEQVKRLVAGPVSAGGSGSRPTAAGAGAPALQKKGLPGWTWGALTAVVVGIAVALSVSRKPASPEPVERAASPDPKPAMATIPVVPVNNKSLVVLPFENLSPDKENEFFTSGIHEEILGALQTLQDLRVIQYRGTSRPIRHIGEELRVAFALECSVRRAGTKVRVTGKLTDTRTEELVWVDKFEGDLTDVFAIQTQLAKAIAARLSAALSPVEKSVLERRPTTNVAAYDLYLKARDIRSRSLNTETGTRRTETLLLSAVELDPQFALAWGELAFTHAFMYSSGEDRSEQRLAQARQALARIQELAPGEAETLRAEGNFYYFTARDYPRALELFTRSLAMRPHDPESYQSLAQVQRRQGKWAECVANYQRALALDPQDDRLLRNTARTLAVGRHYDEAIALERRRVNYTGDFLTPRVLVAVYAFRASGSTTEGDQAAREFSSFDHVFWATRKGDGQEAVRHDDPASKSTGIVLLVASSLRGLGDAAAARRRVEGLTEQLQAALVTQPTNAGLWMQLAQVHSLFGRHEEALACGRKAMELLPESADALSGPQNSATLASIEAWAGHTDKALSEYARVLRNGGANVHELRAEALPAALKQDPRFLALLADPKNNQPLF